MKSVKASKQGLVLIMNAIAERGWDKPSERFRLSIAASKLIDSSRNWEEYWQETGIFADHCSKSTRERFLKGDGIREEGFIAFCEALELNPYEVAENLEPASKLKQLEWQVVRYGCHLLLNQVYLIPEAKKPVLKLLDTAKKRISLEKNELIETPLPKNFKVYVKGESIISHPEPGYDEKVLLTFNKYEGKDGGYIGCYSHKKETDVCHVGGGIYLIGQIRLQGEYNGRIFVPKGYEDRDISTVRELKDLCEQYFPSAKGDVWPGADTGGWFEFPTSIG